MENFETIKSAEEVPQPKDISSEFLIMSPTQFSDFLRTQRKESALSIAIDWKDTGTAKRLKGFIEGGVSSGQKRFATIRATEEQWKQALNVFASGVKWEKVE